MAKSLISLMMWTSGKKLFSERKAETFFNLLEGDILYAQQYALLNRESVRIIFDNDHHRYYSKGHYFEGKIFERMVSDDIFFEGTSIGYRIKFTTAGSLSQSGTLGININGEKYKVVFYLGSGRFKWSKL
ncbi:competence type IV pilus minor pilin ComGD [Bacillus carboniphilus]|uniref:Competence type IV pilus minor pilin ComGD n=1 Tax=Bacillus carboniphilus TaxID=86663 RepID=A0ABY9K1X4_9BACI|nr:competence type IV pilus minor pilin ComGD [Bacillus carboniphilus]WLR43921.1 competence type IV pilus minor pilin ComGD [Bacillus carboniphilus]